MPNKRCPDCKSCKACDENVEKVVKPPQNPTAPSRYQSPLEMAISTPISKDPIAFAANVPISEAIDAYEANKVNPYRAILPNAPPTPTSKNSRNI